MTWTTIPTSVLEVDQPIRSIDIIALRDNILAVPGAAAGAPRVVARALADAMPTIAATPTLALAAAAGNEIEISGNNVTITGIDAAPAGAVRTCRVAGTGIVLAHSGTFQLAGNANVALSPWDVFRARSHGGGTWTVHEVFRFGSLPMLQSGGAFTGRVWSAPGTTTGNSGISTPTPSLGEIEIRSNGAGAAMIVFHRVASRAEYFGLDTDDQWKVGGWSAGAVASRLWHARNSAGVRAWAVCSGVGAILASQNIASVTRVSLGRFRPNFASGLFPDARYGVAGSAVGEITVLAYETKSTTTVDLVVAHHAAGPVDHGFDFSLYDHRG